MASKQEYIFVYLRITCEYYLSYHYIWEGLMNNDKLIDHIFDETFKFGNLNLMNLIGTFMLSNNHA